ncbi:NADP-dependent D-sorbitol-6-phosphate dehydrogenase-like [Chenopodium quinoa]|uniref:NADP-dependent D-sorbitol-6-phosphate dehydrogenase-like n=1 Tax=Chenopodium quinoa TaxID=63459 RepID=UPI000B76C26C|nr:NADP-dependent D-sorbitol-6-phosphate dehydrogenase-like [Chenopodium quinoa]
MASSPCSSTSSFLDEFDDDSLLIRRWRTPETKGIVTLSLKRVQKLSFFEELGSKAMVAFAFYQNEAEVGEALAEAIQVGLVKREDLFITTKLWSSDHGHVHEACKDSLKQLRLDYMDLYLVHLLVATEHTDHVGIMQKFV